MQDLSLSVLDKLGDMQARSDAKLQDMASQLALVPGTLGVAVRSMEVMEENIKVAQREIQAELVEQCKADEYRLQSCETKLRTLPDWINKVKAINTTIVQMKGLEKDIHESKLFIERQLPGLIHLQLVEGLNVVSGDQAGELLEWQKHKLEELVKHDTDSAGKQP